MKRSGFRFKGVEFDLPPKGAKAPRVHSLATPQRGKISRIESVAVDVGAVDQAAAAERYRENLERSARVMFESAARMFDEIHRAQNPKRSKRYRAWVAGLACAHCHLEGFSQAAHGDAGKGIGIKACDSTCFPLCADRPMQIGCHYLYGMTGALGREERRRLEFEHAKETRKQAIEAGVYPKGWLP